MEHSITCKNCKTEFLDNKEYEEHQELCERNTQAGHLPAVSQPIRPAAEEWIRGIPVENSSIAALDAQSLHTYGPFTLIATSGTWQCPFEDCDKVYSFYGSFLSHLEAFHPIPKPPGETKQEVVELTLESLADAAEIVKSTQNYPILVQESEDSSQEIALKEKDDSHLHLFTELNDGPVARNIGSSNQFEYSQSFGSDDIFSLANLGDHQTQSHQSFNFNFFTQDCFGYSLQNTGNHSSNNAGIFNFIGKDSEEIGRNLPVSKTLTSDLIEDSASNYSMSSDAFSVHEYAYAPKIESLSCDQISTLVDNDYTQDTVDDSVSEFSLHSFSDTSSNSRLNDFFELSNIENEEFTNVEDVVVLSAPEPSRTVVDEVISQTHGLNDQNENFVNDDFGNSSFISCMKKMIEEKNKEELKSLKKSKKNKNRFSKKNLLRVTKRLKNLYKKMRSKKRKRLSSDDIMDDETLWNSTESKKTVIFSMEDLESSPLPSWKKYEIEKLAESETPRTVVINERNRECFFDESANRDFESVDDRLDIAIYHKLLHDFSIRYSHMFRQEQIMRAIFLSTGNFDAASELLDKYFNYEEVSPSSRNVIFTSHEDKKLKRGHRKLENHLSGAIEDRLLFLGLDF